MDGIFNNTWFVGIVGGMVSSFAVFFITNLIISRRERKEIRQHIQIANSEIIYSMRHLTAEKVLPEAGLLDSILSSTARKHGLNKEDLYSVDCLADDIINEIMSNPFLSSQQKVEYGEFVLCIKSAEPTNALAAYRQTQSSAVTGFFKDKGRRDISFILGAITFSYVLLGVVSSNLGTGSVTLNKEMINNTLWVIAGAILIPTLFIWVWDFYRDGQALKRVELEANAELGLGTASDQEMDQTES
ncbi:MAG TPA: hypothetical protein VGO96_21060 [Pyrinomonadaceae bacterium]|jgi:hypothetical protein|nr:hypothetical protein [Pyrinomonadaceae bacterium]